MTQESKESLDRQLSESLSKFAKGLWVLLAASFALGGWVTTLEVRARESTKIMEEFKALQTWSVAVDANRWSIRDHHDWATNHDEKAAKELAALNKRNELQELRLQRLEDEQGRILQTIENKLQTTPADVLRAVEEVKKGLSN